MTTALSATSMEPGQPVLRWAGSKKSMAPTLAKLLPSSWDTYVEPMVGSGALFFFTKPASAVIADTNEDLINFYLVLRDSFRDLRRRLAKLSASEIGYYSFRNWRPRGRIQRAVRFAYLTRLSWNGVYRVNRAGHFNVPIGDRRPLVMWNMDELARASTTLANAKVAASDFRETASAARAGDFVFLDPPYPRGAKDSLGFNRYSSELFLQADHNDLASVIRELTKRNVYVMLTIADSKRLRSVYPSTLRQETVRSKSLISSNGRNRRNVNELVLMNY